MATIKISDLRPINNRDSESFIRDLSEQDNRTILGGLGIVNFFLPMSLYFLSNFKTEYLFKYLDTRYTNSINHK